MSVTSYTLDQLMTLMGDTYDATVNPRRIFRNNKNRIWLLFQGIAAGYQLINDMVVSLSNKFDPSNCSDDDLLSTAKLVGTLFKVGKSSFVQINFTNTDVANPHTITAGVYQFTSTSGEVFNMTLAADTVFTAGQTIMMIFASTEKGAFSVTAVASVSISRADLASIDPNFSFATLDNSRYLGYLDETPLVFRQRILSDTNRQDAIAELELLIRSLPNVLECNLIFNPSGGDVVYDGITIHPFCLLVNVTGFPDLTLGQTVIGNVQYLTVETDPTKVFNITDSHFATGSLPVYWNPHTQKNFALTVTYRFDSNKIIQSRGEAQMLAALNAAYANMSQHIDTVTVADIINLLQGLGLASVQLLQVSITPAGGGAVNYLDFLKTRLANLTGVTFAGTDIA
jgi:hypothetical protein